MSKDNGQAFNKTMGCCHGRPVGQSCPHCLGINNYSGQPKTTLTTASSDNQVTNGEIFDEFKNTKAWEIGYKAGKDNQATNEKEWINIMGKEEWEELEEESRECLRHTPIGKCEASFDEPKDNQGDWEAKFDTEFGLTGTSRLGKFVTDEEDIKDFIRELLKKQKEEMVEKVKEKKAKDVSDELVDEVAKQMTRDGLRHVIGGVYNNAIRDVIDIINN